jgi:hypothetical protein
MKIRKGAYYRTRGGDVVGPMQFREYASDPWYTDLSTWREGGLIWQGNGLHELDLISEVYVSDTPPGLTATTITNGLPHAMPETKTLRDEFAIAALPVVWESSQTHRSQSTLASQAYAFADAMMEARKK